MNKYQRIHTQIQWIETLTAKSPVISPMEIGRGIKKDCKLNTLAFTLANSDEHNVLIIRGIENLIKYEAASADIITTLLKDIICNDTYGKFCELAAYDWIMQRWQKITIQISLNESEVMGDNGTILDGRMDFFNIHFDVKAFGFHGYYAKRLKERLEAELPGLNVFIEESWDVSVEEFNHLITDAHNIAKKLRDKKYLPFGRMVIRVVVPQPIMISSRVNNPYLLAKENAHIPFKSANQFTMHSPFLLIFVLHPWLNQLAIHKDIFNNDSIFTRSFSRRAFMQFTYDKTEVRTLCKEISSTATLADAAQLLSGIMFLNVWPSDAYPSKSSESHSVPSWIYLNPRATHKINSGTLRTFPYPNVGIDDFADDDY
jgi:hypothetical protein